MGWQNHASTATAGAQSIEGRKPTNGKLLARVRRSLRRAAHAPANGNGSSNGHPKDRASDDVSLSPREREILALLADGKSQQEISSALVISPKTVSSHLQRILTKLAVHSRAQAVVLAYQLGLVTAGAENTPSFLG